MAAPSNMKTREKTVFVAQQLHFANTLAGNDPKLRDKAMRKLRKYFEVRTVGSVGFSQDDFMRIWKGLFYCMWMSDKPLIQEELAEKISQLVHCFERVNVELAFVKSFFDTLMVEWYGIDFHRLDKFQMFVRRFLRQCLLFCKNKNWNGIAVTGLCGVFQSTVLSPSKCVNECADISLVMHFVDIFMEELAKVSGGKLPMDSLLEFLKPFAVNLTNVEDFRVQNVIRDRIFFCLIKQSPEGMEYEEKFEAWKRAGFPGKSWKEMVFVGKNDKRSGVKIKHLDPRAGLINVCLPHLQFDSTAVAKMLQGYAEKTPTRRCGKFIRKIAQRFQDLAGNNYPLVTNLPKRILDPNKFRFSKQKIDDAVEDYLNFSENLERRGRGGKSLKRKMKDSATKMKQSKKRKLENWTIEESSERVNLQDLALVNEDNDNMCNDSNDSVFLGGKTDNLLTSPEQKKDFSLVENVTLDNSEQCEENDKSSYEKRKQVNPSSKNVTKKKKRTQNVSSWSISEICSLQENNPDSQEIRIGVEKENLPEYGTEVDDDDLKIVSAVAPQEIESQDETYKHTESNEDEHDILQMQGEEKSTKSNEEIVTTTFDVIKLVSVSNNQENDTQEKEIISEDLGILQKDQDIGIPLRRSTRKRTNVIPESTEVTDKGKVNGTPAIEPPEESPEKTPVQTYGETPFVRSTAKRKLSEVISSNEVIHEEDKKIEEIELAREDESTQLRRRRLLNPYAVLRGKGRISKVPDREIPGVLETSVQEATNDTSTDISECSDESPVNNTSMKISDNSEMLDKQESAFSTPQSILRGKKFRMKKRVSLQSTPGSSKKVNIVLQMNRSQGVLEYEKAVRRSPSVPHDATKKPCKGVLKQTSIKSPINPFYLPPKGLK